MDYFELSAKVDRLTLDIRAAWVAGDLYNFAAARLERAHCEMRLRDLWGPWTREGERWANWMRDDVEQACAAAAELARRIGDSQLVQRLLHGRYLGATA